MWNICLLLIQLQLLLTFAEKYNNYIAYLDNILFKNLKLHLKYNYRENTNVRDILSILHFNSAYLRGFIRANFSPYIFITSIVGSIWCCTLPSHITKVDECSSNSKEIFWTFYTSPKFQINSTFLEANMMHELEEDCLRSWMAYFSTWAKYWKIQFVKSQEILFLDTALEKMFMGEVLSALCFTGRRNAFYVISPRNKLFIGYLYTPTWLPGLYFLFSMVDSRKVKEFTVDWKYRNAYPPMLLISSIKLAKGYTEVTILSYLVLRGKLEKVAIILPYHKPSIIKLFDGPDDQSPSVNSKEGYILFSTFQCFLKVYNESFAGFISNITMISIKQDIYKYITVNNTMQLSMNICSQKLVLHCILNITATDDMYLNVSIVKMDYLGPNIRKCHFGGVSYYEVYNESEERKSFCGVYMQYPSNYSFLPVPMNYVSTGHSVLIVFYGYYPFIDTMEINMEITLTPCKGIYFCGNSKYTYIYTQVKKILSIGR